MRSNRVLVLAAATAATLLLPGPGAGAAVPHTVVVGETLWTIAAASNLTTRALAAYNGVGEDSHVVLGSTIMVPSPSEAAAAMARAGMVPATPSPAAPAPAAAGPVAVSASAPAPMGGYTVRWGDTLSGLAAGAGVSLAQIAAMNGLDPTQPLLAGTVIKLPTGAPAPVRASQPAPAPIVAAAAPSPTPGRVSAPEIQQVAAAHGVPGALAAAIAWQESGFSNAVVSSANARGVMQIMPGTWEWIQRNLSHSPLDPASPIDNVHAGVMYLGRLLAETGGDEAMAVAGYYQGLGSVRSRGLFTDTQRYVANVQALKGRFGG